MTMLSVEPISVSSVDAAPVAAVGIAPVLLQSDSPVASQEQLHDSWTRLSQSRQKEDVCPFPTRLGQTRLLSDLSEKPLASCLAENEQLAKALDQALSDVRQLVAASFPVDAASSPRQTAEIAELNAARPESAPYQAEQPIVGASVVVEAPVVDAIVSIASQDDHQFISDAFETNASTAPGGQTSVAAATPNVVETPVAAETPVVDTSPVVADASDSGRARSESAPYQAEQPIVGASVVVEAPVVDAIVSIASQDDHQFISDAFETNASTAPGGQTSVAVATPIAVETPVATETPVVTETPVAVETPVVATETPVAATETPVAVEAPVAVETPVVATPPVVADASDGGRARSMIAPQSPDDIERVETPAAARPEVAPYQAEDLVEAEASTPVDAASSPRPMAEIADPIAARPEVASYQADDASDAEVEAPVGVPEPTADAIVAAGIVPAPEIAAAAERTVEASAAAAPAASAASQSSAAVMPSQALVETASAVADALIVTPGLMRGEGVVTVQLKSEVLDGAQVTIAVNGRQMEVAFASGSTAAAALIERNLTQIQQYLGARIHSFTIGVKLNRTRS